MADLAVNETKIPGLFEIDLPVHEDSRGYFKENWQQEKFTQAGLPEFSPVQHNIALNKQTGTTRGIHAEPWNKLISVATGSVFAAIVDLRDDQDQPVVETFIVNSSKALLIPKGCANSYQTLEPDVVYSYLVDAHWSPSAEYTFVNLGDSTLAIDWPIPLQSAHVSEKDRLAPFLEQVR